MVRELIIIGNKTYKSQKELETDVRKNLLEVGITKSVKSKSIEKFEYFKNVCKRHPKQEDKLKNIVDFEIKQDVLNKKGLALNIINNDGTETEISWRKCLSGKNQTVETQYNMALRQSISSQILEFKRNNDLSVCKICNESLIDKSIHIDHEIHFAQLVNDFTKLNNITIPTEYNKIPITFEKIFIPKDEWIGKKFYDYHLQNSKLRVVCEKCNLTREKYKKE